MSIADAPPRGNPGGSNGHHSTYNSPFGLVIAKLEEGGYDPRPTGDGKAESECPGHGGSRRNLSVAEGTDGAALVRCHHEPACTAEAIVGALGLEMRDLFRPMPGARPSRGPKGKAKGGKKPGSFNGPDAALNWLANKDGSKLSVLALYRDTAGTLYAAVGRLDHPEDGKTYRPVYRDAESGLWGIGDPPQWFPQRADKIKDVPDVWVYEGERCVEIAVGLGQQASTTSHGAKSAHKSDVSVFAGKNLYFVPDNDPEGEGYVDALVGLASKLDPPPVIKIVRLPGLAEKGDDLAEWVEARKEKPRAEIRAELEQLAAAAPAWTPTAEAKPEAKKEDWVDEGAVANLGDVRKALGELKYVWKGWVQPGTITTLAADAGTGKTLVCLKICKVAWEEPTWPDGSENMLAKGRPSMWLCYDRAWRGILRAAEKMGIPDEAVILPTSRNRPLFVPDLDDPRTIDLLERLIRKFQPWALFIDTMTYATGANVAKAHEAKLAYSPLMGVMAETGCCCISNTHLSNEGKVLNRRPVELSRTVLKLKAPDPENHKRLRFWVDKTDDDRPAPLGVTIGGDALVAFDDTPPLDSDTEGPPRRGPSPEKSTGFAEWLFRYLEPGPAAVASIIDSARDQKLLKSPDTKNPKPSISPLYNAKDRIPRVFSGWGIEEFLAPSSSGKQVKHWKRFEEIDVPGREEDNFVPF